MRRASPITRNRNQRSRAGRPRQTNPDRTQALAARLIAWFGVHARDLPWRRTLDPYAIWVAEIMLQQTQVKTVIPYWTHWMTTLPDVASLASADPQTVLKLWEGLGYYSRARNLQKAAVMLAAAPHQFPTAVPEILALPGIGRYTAGAIASIAFNQPEPILDGNVIRVLTRHFGITANPRKTAVAARLWRLAGQLVAAAFKLPASFPGTIKDGGLRLAGSCSALNQSLMELGATVCTPRQPLCSACPLQADCVAHRTARTATLPNLGRRPRSTSKRSLAFLVEHRGRWLVQQRPADGVNAHLWEFPNIESAPAGSHNGAALAARRALGFAADSPQLFHVVRHTITRYRIVVEAHLIRCRRAPPPQPSPRRWATPRQMESLAWPSAHRRLMLALLESQRSPRPRQAASAKR